MNNNNYNDLQLMSRKLFPFNTRVPSFSEIVLTLCVGILLILLGICLIYKGYKMIEYRKLMNSVIKEATIETGITNFQLK